MPEKHYACRTDEIPPGTGKEFTLGGRIVAVFHVDDTFSAIDGICAHAGGPLGKGEVRDTVVTCPWHGWQYDVRTGQHCLSPQICQNRYTVAIADEEIFVEF